MKRSTVFDNYEVLGRTVYWWRHRIQNVIGIACLALLIGVSLNWLFG